MINSQYMENSIKHLNDVKYYIATTIFTVLTINILE